MFFFTSDTHFFHKNIIGYCERPFTTLDGQPDVPAMNQAIIARWNSVVGKEDTVFHVGDFGFGSENKLAAIRQRLNGKIILIKGNHDHKVNKWLSQGDEVYTALKMGQVWLTHVPPIPFDGRYPLPEIPPNTKLVLCGHVHTEWTGATTNVDGQVIHIINVGTDVWNYTPRTAEELGFNPQLLEENK